MTTEIDVELAELEQSLDKSKVLLSEQNETDKPTVYLSGPIRKVSDNGNGWRNEVIEEYSNTFNFKNPLDRYNPSEHDILNDPVELDEDSEKEQVLPCEYVQDDKMDILASDFVLLGLPDAIARGSMMEIMFAELVPEIPVYVWILEGQTESGWIYHHADMMSKNLDHIVREMVDYE